MVNILGHTHFTLHNEFGRFKLKIKHKGADTFEYDGAWAFVRQLDKTKSGELILRNCTKKEKAVQYLIINHNYGFDKATDLVEKHIDIFETLEDIMESKDIVQNIEEAEMQGC